MHIYTLAFCIGISQYAYTLAFCMGISQYTHTLAFCMGISQYTHTLAFCMGDFKMPAYIIYHFVWIIALLALKYIGIVHSNTVLQNNFCSDI